MLKRCFFIGATWILGLVILRKRNRKRREQHILNTKVINLGRYFGVDVGGTLAKLVYFKSTDPKRFKRRSKDVQAGLKEFDEYILSSLDFGGTGRREEELTLKLDVLGGEMHFMRFETRRMRQTIDFVCQKGLHANIMSLAASGGGAHKFSSLFDEQLGIKLKKCDEMDSLIKGLNFLLHYVPNECYTWKNVSLNSRGLNSATKEICGSKDQERIYPFLVVNIGSGVSILKSVSKDEYVRVSGTSLGGGTFWGLCRLLARCQTFDESMDFSVAGDNQKVDLLVGDIYGGDYDQFGLKSSTIASSFGKAGVNRTNGHEEDMARSLLVMLTQNIGQVAYLNAKKHHTPNIYFCGNFLRRNAIASQQLAYAIHYWSKGEMEAQFLDHEGYLGAIGAFLTENQNWIH